MAEFEIKHDGRTVVSREDIPSVTGSTVTTIIKYDDGTHLECITDSNGEVTVSSNRTFNIMPDGKTIRLTE